MMKTVFFGHGRVVQALCSKIEGSQIVYEETTAGIVVRKRPNFQKDWAVQTLSGQNFDTFESFEDAEQVFISPGIDPRRAFFRRFLSCERREFDYFCDNFKAPVVAITGTNGKSSFTLQLSEVLRRAGLKVFCGGNIGNAMAYGLQGDFDIAVVEVSSFQAERLKSADYAWGVLLNLSPDHLDRYESVEDYYQTKWTLIDRAERAYFPQGLWGSESRSAAGTWTPEAASKVALEIIARDILKTFDKVATSPLFDHLPKPPHRLETWGDVEGRLFINDSKATNVDSVRYALQQLKSPELPSYRRLLLGGRSKGDDFSILKKWIQENDRLFAFGESRDEISKALTVEQTFESLQDAMKSLLPQMEPEDCLLLSPGGSSYDEFRSFEERGTVFRALVQDFYAVEKLKESV